MAQDYSEYLAVNVLNEQQLVSYTTQPLRLRLISTGQLPQLEPSIEGAQQSGQAVCFPDDGVILGSGV